jgi:hypothetical protein
VSSSGRFMTREELVAAGEAIFGPRWVRPLGRAIDWDYRSVRFWKRGQRPIPAEAARRIRKLHQIGPVGTIVRRVLRAAVPKLDPWTAHCAAVQVLSELSKAGLLEQDSAPLQTAA